MYTTCLFCSRSLGTNEAIETFPVGSRVAFDARKGRLWAVCTRCGRWNLAPIEERWEAVEAAERLFVDTRRRVQSQNIGLARLPDGTRLIRVGQALEGELAAWRYGRQLVSRRNRYLAVGSGSLLAGGAILAGLPLIASAGFPLIVLGSGLQLAAAVRERRRIVYKVPAAASPTGAELLIRRSDLDGASLQQLEGELGIDLPEVAAGLGRSWRERQMVVRPALQLAGDAARTVVSRAMVSYNIQGAKPADIEAALRSIEEAGSPDAFARQAAASQAVLSRQRQVRPAGLPITPPHVIGTPRGEVLPVTTFTSPMEWRPRLAKTEALALEIALQEEAERRALEGELASLEAAWREAEEIAHIADSLPD